MANRNIIALILLVLLSTNVLALGVNSQYHNSNPLKMQRGETNDVEFVLVHSTKEKTDVRVLVSLIEGQEIAEIISEKEFTLSPGTLVEDNKKIILRISIPQEASIGDSYIVKLSVAPIEEKEIGTVQLSKVYIVDFPVIVGEESSISKIPQKPEKINANIITVLIILILVILIIAIILLKKKKFK